MTLSQESLPYLIDAMGSTTAGNNLISAIQTNSQLNRTDTIRLQNAFGNQTIAQNFQNCILGTYQLQQTDCQFVKCAFAAPLSVLNSIFSNLSGGISPSVNINRL